MAQPKPKKKSRSRSDPARREAAARREEARRLAAEERRREQEEAERRQKTRKTIRRLAVPALVGVGVVVAAILLFRPQREVEGVEVAETTAILEALGYDLPEEIDQNALPEPDCGPVEAPTALELYAALRNGAVVLLHLPDDTDAAGTLEGMAQARGSLVVVAPNPTITQAVVAVAWERLKRYESADDDGLADFADTYRGRISNGKECPVP